MRLVKSSDALLESNRPGAVKRLGIDYATLSAVKPDLIWAGISALGPEYPEVPGYDPVIQAMAENSTAAPERPRAVQPP
mgnify:CR=1 FL=1